MKKISFIKRLFLVRIMEKIIILFFYIKNWKLFQLFLEIIKEKIMYIDITYISLEDGNLEAKNRNIKIGIKNFD